MRRHKRTAYIHTEGDYQVDIATLINLKVVRWLPLPDRFSAISLPPFGTLVRKEDWDARTPLEKFKLLQHELAHWEQAARYGSLQFYVRYLIYSIRYGYTDNPLEMEAREKVKKMGILRKKQTAEERKKAEAKTLKAMLAKLDEKDEDDE